MTHAVVLGGSGFIGHHVVSRLLASGCSVSVYSRGRPGRTLVRGARWIAAPEADPFLTQFRAALFARRIDLVIHMIAMGEEDAAAAVEAFAGRCGRFLLVSSADVYLAYGRFIRLEQGPPVPAPLDETAALRSRLFPYRRADSDPADLAFRYDKILAEQAVLGEDSLDAAVIRLPKVYGPGGNENFATVYDFAAHPDWRWTHGYVENVAAAIAFLALKPQLPDRVYNVGEEFTPTVAERLKRLPPAAAPAQPLPDYDFRQNLAFDSRRLRALGFRDPIDDEEGLRRTLASRRGDREPRRA